MKELFLSEWERIWARRKTLVSLVLFISLLGLFSTWLHRGAIGFYTPELETSLNALNFPTFLLKEIGFILSLIMLPMFFVDSFNGEYSSGAYRLILIRPHSRGKLLLAKWLSMASVVGIFLGIAFIFSQLLGRILYSAPESITFYPGGHSYTGVGAIGYSLLFYLTFFVIYLALLGIASLVSSFLPNTILSFFSILVVLLGTFYTPDAYHYFILNGEAAFRVLNGADTTPFITSVFGVIVGTFLLVYALWQRRNWTM
ncbi:ABC transporter permease [Marininema halotolerans]|uniref:ABC-2 family transporter protein n=1 Tax=Marininema halotolerans TaxID=1155944 RepID=A0A1I6UGT0_9BACL|nr:ABC transporter permease subunit [Marininema halotolerans]SFT00632.1 ABC-2 family transporter protein [Marininema halotolerans]